MLGDYGEKVKSGYTVYYTFATTARSTERISELKEIANSKYLKNKISVSCEIYDLSGLKDLYLRSQSLEESIPDEVELVFQENNWIKTKNPYPTIIGVIKGNTLRDLYKRHRETLFAFNIRGYLGNRGINNNIIETIESTPESFFYYNNGISAICTDFSESENLIKAKKLQIINGAQTIGALSRSEPNDQVYVLLRLTKGKGVSTEKGFNSDIIRYNNTQNSVKISDFRSNDPIQLWLEKQFSALRPHGALKRLRYSRKRGYGQRGRGVRLVKIEDLAKIRYSYLYEPTQIPKAPRELWTLDEEEGHYNKTFGENGELNNLWQDDTWWECLLAICLFFKIDEVTKEEVKERPEFKHFRRTRYHAMSLAGLYYRYGKVDNPKSLLKSNPKFESIFTNFWDEARRLLIDSYIESTDTENLTLNSYLLSTERWNKMKKKFVAITRLKLPNGKEASPKTI